MAENVVLTSISIVYELANVSPCVVVRVSRLRNEMLAAAISIMKSVLLERHEATALKALPEA